MVQVTNYGIGGFGNVMESENVFWNNIFEKELPRYKYRLDMIFPCCPLETIHVKTAYGHVFSQLYNYSINIMFIIDCKSMPSLGVLNKRNKA